MATNWFFDGSKLNTDDTPEEQNMKMAKALKNVYDSFLAVGFSKTEAMQLLVGMVQGACNPKK